ncbi:sialate O-acetylesterase [Halobacterium litoreum]|uniref:Sialate O-acetylesterase n=1 Tax=Halobacterium litoreum TaxID=2039234 RepID=A0ABD5NG48_9EURY|nr:sialate O-acetylesterase [Halobacterium litoreum]UHH12949.1 sialate O-acetylesterase [Halobacterium litoreum]
MPAIDVFAVGGQSNAVGRGRRSRSPRPERGTAIEYRHTTDSLADPLRDPVLGNGDAADTGSAWPAFAIEYHERVGRPVGIVGAARGSTAQSSRAGGRPGDWDGGALDEDLIRLAEDALAAFEAAGYDPTFRGVLWHQGERDAMEIDRGSATRRDYRRALEGMIARYRDAFGAGMPVWLFELGRRASGDTSGFRAVREAQREVVREQSRTYLVSDKQASFPERGLQENELHYAQAGYDEMGRVGARNVAARVDGESFQAKRSAGRRVDAYTGAPGEPVMSLDDGRLSVHDGETPGGNDLAREDER